MRKSLLAIGLVLLLLICGCMREETPQTCANVTLAGGEITDTPIQEKTEIVETSEADASFAESSDVDIDLTTLGSNLVYSQVYNMVNEPKDYIGKRVKMSGVYTEEFYDVTGQTYHYVVISDATACCQSGMEFICEDKDCKYPKEGELVEITGTYGSYDELDVTYYYVSAETMDIK